jgi:hypothetical protein
MRTVISYWPERIEFRFFLLQYFPSAVGGSIVYDNNFMRDATEIQLEVEMFHCRRDTAFLVACGDDD